MRASLSMAEAWKQKMTKKHSRKMGQGSVLYARDACRV